MADTKNTAAESVETAEVTEPKKAKETITIAVPVPVLLHKRLNKLRFKTERERLTHVGIDALTEYADKHLPLSEYDPAAE